MAAVAIGALIAGHWDITLVGGLTTGVTFLCACRDRFLVGFVASTLSAAIHLARRGVLPASSAKQCVPHRL